MTNHHLNASLCGAALLLTISVGVSAQQKPNFAGTWSLEPGGQRASLTEMASPPETLTIQQSADTLTVQKQVGDETEATVMRLDGHEDKVLRLLGPAYKNRSVEALASCTWQSAKLVTTYRIAAGAADNPTALEYREVRSVDRSGRMVVETTRRGGTGRQIAVYTRASSPTSR